MNGTTTQTNGTHAHNNHRSGQVRHPEVAPKVRDERYPTISLLGIPVGEANVIEALGCDSNLGNAIEAVAIDVKVLQAAIGANVGDKVELDGPIARIASRLFALVEVARAEGVETYVAPAPNVARTKRWPGVDDDAVQRIIKELEGYRQGYADEEIEIVEISPDIWTDVFRALADRVAVIDAVVRKHPAVLVEVLAAVEAEYERIVRRENGDEEDEGAAAPPGAQGSAPEQPVASSPTHRVAAETSAPTTDAAAIALVEFDSLRHEAVKRVARASVTVEDVAERDATITQLRAELAELRHAH